MSKKRPRLVLPLTAHQSSLTTHLLTPDPIEHGLEQQLQLE